MTAEVLSEWHDCPCLPAFQPLWARQRGQHDGRCTGRIGSAQVKVAGAGQAQHEARIFLAVIGAAGPWTFGLVELDLSVGGNAVDQRLAGRVAELARDPQEDFGIAGQAVAQGEVVLSLQVAIDRLGRDAHGHLQAGHVVRVAGQLPGAQAREGDAGRTVAPGDIGGGLRLGLAMAASPLAMPSSSRAQAMPALPCENPVRWGRSAVGVRLAASSAGIPISATMRASSLVVSQEMPRSLSTACASSTLPARNAPSSSHWWP